MVALERFSTKNGLVKTSRLYVTRKSTRSSSTRANSGSRVVSY